MQQALDLPLVINVVGDSAHWHYVNSQMGRRVMASLVVREGRTTIRVQEGFKALLGAIYGGVGGGAAAAS